MMPSMPFLDHVENGDFVGALTVIGEPRSNDEDNKSLWRAYCLSRLGQHAKAKEIYIDMLSSGENNGGDDCGVSRNTIMLYLSIVYCRLGDFSSAEELALAVDFGDKDDGLIRQESSLRVRILLHIAQRTRNETKVSEYRQQLTDSLEDALAAAAVDFSFRNRYEDAAVVYNKILARDGKELALSVFRYVAICGLALYLPPCLTFSPSRQFCSALCLFRQGSYEESLAAGDFYLQVEPESPFAVNLRACNMHHLCDDGGKSALDLLTSQLPSHSSREPHPLISHNVVALKGGEKALSTWPKLLKSVPQARLNLALYYLMGGEVEAATDLMNEVEADSPQSHLVCGILHARRAETCACGEEQEDALELARHHFLSSGGASTECDTVNGRQSMASYLFLMNQFEDALHYLDSIREHQQEDDAYYWNRGMALCASGDYAEGLAALLKVSDESFKKELAYNMWSAKCHIELGNVDEAWECYLQAEDKDVSYEVLQLVANECYRRGGNHLIYSARAFFELTRLDSFADFENGFLGACVGYFRHLVVAPGDDLQGIQEILDMMDSSVSPKVVKASNTIKNWAIAHRSPL